MATPFYTRYVPPKPTTPLTQPVEQAPSEQLGVQAATVKDDALQGKKRKRSKGSTEAKSQAPEVQVILESPEIDQAEQKAGGGGAVHNGDQFIDRTPRTKRSKQKPRAATPVDADEDDQDKGKYAAIFAKYQKSAKLADIAKAGDSPGDVVSKSIPETSIVKQGLTPIPQPTLQEDDDDNRPRFSALPPWLSKPIIVPSTTRQAFSELGLSEKVLANIHKKGFTETFAIQSALLPALLPGPSQYPGDLCVSAPTGSGKTLAYMLPMVEQLKAKLVTRVRALVLVPTRELVIQAKEIAEFCAAGTGLQIGSLAGNIPVETERDQLVHKGQRFDPEAAAKLLEEAREQMNNAMLGFTPLSEHLVGLLPNHVPEYSTNFDILICTPGRVVEHILTTPGFSLDHVEWLVIDEADQLLDQSFQEWTPCVLEALQNRAPTAYDKVLSQMWLSPPARAIRKVILSATMTRDLNKLTSLKLKRPTLVAVADQHGNVVGQGEEFTGGNEQFSLPNSLAERAISVADGNEKPLYLLQLLESHILIPTTDVTESARTKITMSRQATRAISSASSSSNSDSDSDGDSDSSTSSNDSDLTSESNIDSEADVARFPTKLATTSPNNVLVFTNSNENAHRLSRLLTLLSPPLVRRIATLTKSSSHADTRKLLHDFAQDKIQVLIASDRASRGLDIPRLQHVVNYDMPKSLHSYVHRGGRTARAGQPGTAWTLVASNEARWFWNAIGRSAQIGRHNRRVERFPIDMANVTQQRRDAYTRALAKLRDAVLANSHPTPV